MSSKASSTIGFERRFNRALRVDDLHEFVNERLHSATPRPPNIDRIVELNRGPFVGPPEPLDPTTPNGAIVLDVRPEEEFAAGHVPGAINVPLSGSAFATKAGFMLDPGERIAIHASSAADVEHAARGLRSVGFLDLAGYLVEPDASERSDTYSVDDLERLLADESVEVVDVREKDERDEGYIPESRHLPYRQARACAEELDGGPVVTICETGVRAAIAASALRHEGIDARPVLWMGIDDWRAQGKPLVSFRRCGS
jgi:hydroxyacylglutathione hydrolase